MAFKMQRINVGVGVNSLPLYQVATPATTSEIEILTRDGSTILTRDGSTVIARE